MASTCPPGERCIGWGEPADVCGVAFSMAESGGSRKAGCRNQSQCTGAYFSFKIFYVLQFAQHLGDEGMSVKEVPCVSQLT